MLNRRTFLKQSSAAFVLADILDAQTNASSVSLVDCTIVVPVSASARVKRIAAVLVEEVQRRSQIRWTIADTAKTNVTISFALAPGLHRDGYSIEAASFHIKITAPSDRGLLFGVGKLLRTLVCSRQNITLDVRRVIGQSEPRYRLRGHQLGYRPKTNAYDGWDVAQWDQYIRDLAVFGTNAIELIPPRSDDAADSPHFPLPPDQMMVEMSRICDSYDLDVWIWYPAMDPDYADPATTESAIKEWSRTFERLPRIDAIFVPGGDPGHTAPRPMFAFLEKQKASLHRFHPNAQVWMSPQGFRQEWMDEFFHLLDQPQTSTWLDGIVFGPQSRYSIADFRKRVPLRYPIRLYPDITHSTSCQYPVPDWDVAFALTEGREVINPRPAGEANILRRACPHTIGFLTYSEGCNDDVNKFIWSSLGWDPQLPPVDALREFAHYFFGASAADSAAQGLLSLEKNWSGALATNQNVRVTLRQFQQLEQNAPPALLENWRFQQALYRAYYDEAVQSRLLRETGGIERAMDLLAQFNEVGWRPEPLGTGDPLSAAPPNGRDPSIVIDQADRALLSAASCDDLPSRARVRELGEALFQSIHMQLAVNRYRAEGVERAGNLETLDYPVTSLPWLRAQLSAIRKLASANEQLAAIDQLVNRANPGPGGFYDDLGDPQSRPHLELGLGPTLDPDFRDSALTGFHYPDTLGASAPIEWKRWAEALFDAPLKMHYDGLDPAASYKIRVVYGGEARHIQIKLTANNSVEIHPLLTRPSPPQPLEFDIPPAATSAGKLDLAWTREKGLGGNGRGCQVCEVWLIKK